MEVPTFVEIAERLSAANPLRKVGSADLFISLLREIAKGSPVSREKLAAVLGWPLGRVAAALDQIPNTEYDDGGNILGIGLTLRETPHVFEIDGRRLYTWCALDALMFPALIGKTARVLSRCAATGAPVSLTVTPDGVRNVEPEGAAVSLVLPDASPNVRGSFCCHVHFFASTLAADGWTAKHGDVLFVSVEDAFRLGQKLNQTLAQST
ncbi:organomercurial lyase MerB [Cupriavidus taiwanensis]|uniref:organomercurial lyase MerB n=1 Tax=Pseudomonadota TaxID=1224 RepID=UPI000FEECD95|nr:MULTISPECIES: organomercurial lyase MerB [Pseudomonadota]TNY01581.1 organomercurial lyase MerB [Stenotrophomonas maltophilia]MDK3026504.1 organomercurial lyase MerB [Cupriavidus taiwanensis]RPS27352.1 alkylmercury lyase [Pseudomonas aeruginosa]TPD80310.1 organomercurial lyase MerB [Stenotrophomonas maltophilia]TPD82303.1 organomercurial lyase MerB [Stenotrophomonas maltophilia]